MHRLSIQQHLPGGRRFQTGQNPDQRRLAAARRSDDTNELALVGFEIDILQRRHRALVAFEILVQTLHLQHHGPLLQAREAVFDLVGLFQVTG